MLVHEPLGLTAVRCEGSVRESKKCSFILNTEKGNKYSGVMLLSSMPWEVHYAFWLHAENGHQAARYLPVTGTERSYCLMGCIKSKYLHGNTT
jgi:hypothetical protein